MPVLPTLLALTLLLVGVLVLSAAVGEAKIPPGTVVQAVLHRFAPAAFPVDEQMAGILWDLRLPRVALAALVGAALALAGAALQGLVGNPLADPYTIGVSSGASVGAGIAILLGFGGALGGLGLPLAAFAASLISLVLVLALARVGGRLHAGSFLLAGVVAGSFLWAITTLLLSLAGTDQKAILSFLMGRFTEADGAKVAILFPFVVVGVIVFTLCGRGLDAFSFGEEIARSVGVEVERFKVGILLLCALLTAVAVAVSGVIGFVGLIVPHVARGLVGPPHRSLIPVCALLGASLTCLADLAARTIRPGEEIPVGVITALLGAPFFVVLLRRQMGR